MESLDEDQDFRVEKSGRNSTELEVPWVRYYLVLILSWCRRESHLGCCQPDLLVLHVLLYL